jgi:hypothetical protein
MPAPANPRRYKVWCREQSARIRRPGEFARRIRKMARRICRICTKPFSPGSGCAKNCRRCMRARPLCACGCGQRVRAIGISGSGKLGTFVDRHQMRVRSAQMRRAAARKASVTLREGYLSGRLKIRHNFGSRSKKSYIRTPWGRFFCDSSWERAFALWLISAAARILTVTREVPVKYLDTEGVPHMCFVDFLVVWQNGKQTLVEVKNPELCRRQSRRLRAVRRYAVRLKVKFVLLRSLEACCAGI